MLLIGVANIHCQECIFYGTPEKESFYSGAPGKEAICSGAPDNIQYRITGLPCSIYI